MWDQWSSVTFDRSLLFKHTAPSAVESKLQFDLIWFDECHRFYLLINMCPQLLSEEGHVTPTCHHRFIKWLCTIQMKNKIRNTEMEYIARANRCVDSSFLADGSGRLIGALVFYCTYVVGGFVLFFLSCLRVRDLCSTQRHCSVSMMGRCCRVSEEFFFFSFQTYKRILWLHLAR